MMPDESLILLLDEVRGKTLCLLVAVSEDQARWTPPGLQNSILWHAGHAYLLLEWLTMKALGHTPDIPDRWYELFSWDSRPADSASSRWPAFAEVITRLEEQHARMTEIVKSQSKEALDKPVADHPGMPVRFAILHALRDEACHCGEIHLLRKLHRHFG